MNVLKLVTSKLPFTLKKNFFKPFTFTYIILLQEVWGAWQNIWIYTDGNLARNNPTNKQNTDEKILNFFF